MAFSPTCMLHLWVCQLLLLLWWCVQRDLHQRSMFDWLQRWYNCLVYWMHIWCVEVQLSACNVNNNHTNWFKHFVGCCQWGMLPQHRAHVWWG